MLLIQLPIVPVSMFELSSLRSAPFITLNATEGHPWEFKGAAQFLEVGQRAELGRQRPAQLVQPEVPAATSRIRAPMVEPIIRCTPARYLPCNTVCAVQ
jgi:hypothetical protein